MRTIFLSLAFVLIGWRVQLHAIADAVQAQTASPKGGAVTLASRPAVSTATAGAVRTNSPAPTSVAPASKGSIYNDLKLERAVRRLLEDDPFTRPFASKTTVQNGIVTLAGQTFHPDVKAAAERGVSRVPGVRSVRNLITVEPNADLQIAQRLHEAFARDSSIHEGAIAVAVIDGKVFLSGTAESTNEVARINALTWSVPGVRTLSNGLTVSTSSASRTLPRQVATPQPPNWGYRYH